jgi:hypothetical protein
MPDKQFERTLRFYEHQNPDGSVVYLSLVDVILITQTGRISLSLIFDTGASVTTLRRDLYPLLGLSSWDQGQAVPVSTANGNVYAYQYRATFEIFDKIIDCPVQLLNIPQNPLYHGLLGRDTVFNEFGFGFWESTHELYVTSTP